MAQHVHGDGTVYQRGDGRWVASLRLLTGKRVLRYAKSRTEATSKLQDLRRQHIQGTLTTPAKITLGEWVDAWMAGLDVRPADRAPDRPIFRSIHGNPPCHDQLHKPLAALCKFAGVPRLNVHGLRHVAAALSYRATGNALAVQRRLGHTRITTTLGIYAYLMAGDDETASAIDGQLRSASDTATGNN